MKRLDVDGQFPIGLAFSIGVSVAIDPMRTAACTVRAVGDTDLVSGAAGLSLFETSWFEDVQDSRRRSAVTQERKNAVT